MIRRNIINIVKLMASVMGIAVGVIVIISVFPKEDENIDMSGFWEMTFKVQKSSLDRYDKGRLTYKYKIALTQNDTKIEGEGEKFWENFNGVETNYDRYQKTPIRLEGKIKKNILKAHIRENGTRRSTSGYIELEINEEINKIEGTFTSTAANSSGTVILKKINN